ncbi:hypothetical protein [Streptomyces sp. NPDC052127]|uniref:hypothetical protein n=1 Tax=Streptomyces sp. NPDC052127 TaxID=3155679 RepID=UPI003444C9FD
MPAARAAAVAWVMHRGGFVHRRHLLAEGRRHLALVLHSRYEPSLKSGLSTPRPLGGAVATVVEHLLERP